MPPWSVKMSQNKKTNLTFKLVGVTNPPQHMFTESGGVAGPHQAEMKSAKGTTNIVVGKKGTSFAITVPQPTNT